MSLIQDEAITLRRLDYSETSQVLVFFTREHGRSRLIAKGIKRSTKKKYAVGIDLLERGRAVFTTGRSNHQGLGTLTEWRQIEAHLGLPDSLKRLYAAQYAAEITTAMTEDEDPHSQLYDSLADLLEKLSHGTDPLPAVIDYQCDLLYAAGFWPDLTRCVICDRLAPPGRAGYFSATQGGLVCRRCQENLPEKRLLPAKVLTALRQKDYSPGKAEEIFDLLDYAISQNWGKQTTLAHLVHPSS